MDRPIVILAVPRSGSSMVCGVFAEHGVWTGPCKGPRAMNPRGFFENIDFRSIFLNHFGNIVEECRAAWASDAFTAEILRTRDDQGYEGGPWLIKAPYTAIEAYKGLNPYWVRVLRSRRPVLRSAEATRVISMPELQVDYQLSHFADVSSPIVDTEAVVGGDLSSLESAFDYCGLEFTGTDTIEAEYWHF